MFTSGAGSSIRISTARSWGFFLYGVGNIDLWVAVAQDPPRGEHFIPSALIHYTSHVNRQGVSGWKLHAIHHLTASFDEDGHPHSWRAIHPDSYPLEFFEYHSELHEAPQRSSHR